MCGLHTLIEAFKKELAWTTDKRLQVISNITLLKTVIPLRNYVKNKAVLRLLNNVEMHCYVVLSNIF